MTQLLGMCVPVSPGGALLCTGASADCAPMALGLQAILAAQAMHNRAVVVAEVCGEGEAYTMLPNVFKL